MPELMQNLIELNAILERIKNIPHEKLVDDIIDCCVIGDYTPINGITYL